MIIRLHKQNFTKDIKLGIYHKIILVLCFLPFSVFGQVTFSKIPLDKQLVARDTITNLGEVVIEGQVDNSSTPYESIQIKVFREGASYHTENYVLDYNGGNLAGFIFNLKIVAELFNYSFEVYGLTNGLPDEAITTVINVVAGDVYIIQGQSNAVALRQGTNYGTESKRDYIRVYASGDDDWVDLEQNNQWFIADSDGGQATDGNAGQWGRKLASLLVDSSQHYPIAIFNGARGGKPIQYFLENYSGSLDNDPDTNNYERLKYRLEKTGLQNAVKAVFWSQGENVSSTLAEYKNNFLSLRDSWIGDNVTPGDYPNIEHIYIFQTINGCNAYTNNFEKLMYSKEAQRQLAAEYMDIQIINTDGLVQYSDNCHFVYNGGYTGFAERLYPLVMQDFYGGPSTEDQESPDILDAYLMDDITLVVETSSNSLFMVDPVETANNFELANANGSTIIDLEVSVNQIIFTLSSYPGSGATISNLGAIPGVQDHLITNTSIGPEILSFYEFPIDASGITIWSSAWSNGIPTQTLNAIVDNDLTVSSANLETKNLKINSGVNLDFDNGTNNSVVIYGDLTVDGSFIVGDTESLIIDDVNAKVTIDGTFTKKEKTTELKSLYDVTYWSSPVENVSLGSTFYDVDPNRIFYMDPTAENSNYTGTYFKYRHWFITDPADLMIPGKAFSVDGKTNASYPTPIEFDFNGKPNYKDITIPINTFTTVGDDSDRTNLLGNPYPAAIDPVQLIVENSGNFEGTLYIWSHGTEYTGGEYEDVDYLSYNESGSNRSEIIEPYHIASGQGFMILAKVGASSFDFKNSMQVENVNDQFFKSPNSIKNKTKEKINDRIWLKLIKDHKERKEILIGFTNRASEGIDYGYDGKFLNSDALLTFYSLIDNDKYAIQGLGPFAVEKSIDLGFSTQETGEFTITRSKIEGILKEQEILLVDKQLNIIHDLNQGDYLFEETTPGDFPNRFTLQFTSTTLGLEDLKNENNFTVINSPGGFKIQAAKVIDKLKVYDLLGRLLYQNEPKKKSFEINVGQIKKGTIVIFETTLENGVVLTKKTIKF